MKQPFRFDSDVRASALLCSAAVLLTACGGGTSDAGPDQAAKTAAYSYNSAANEPAAAVTALTAADAAVATADAVTPAAKDELDQDAIADRITELYLSLLDRTPDIGGMVHWLNAAKYGYSLDEIAAMIKGSPEYIQHQNSKDEPRTTYHLYVATTGSDSGSAAGTEAAPFKTITRAARAARPSTTIHVAPGIYEGNVDTLTNGNAAGRIRYVSDIKWGAKIVGEKTEAAWTNRGDYTDIVGFDISGTGRLGILNLASYVAIKGNFVHDLKVSGGCTGNGGAGINNGSYTDSDNDIIGNVVRDIGVPGSCNGVHGIYHANLRGKIYNNIVYRSASFGIHLWHAATDVLVANNTVFSNGGKNKDGYIIGGGIVMGTGDAPNRGKKKEDWVLLSNTKVVNNIVYDNPGRSISQFCYSGEDCIGPNNVIANNLVYRNGRDIDLLEGRATGTIKEDPGFAQYQPDGTPGYYGTGDYRLTPQSPAVDRGIADYAPTTDIFGNARPLGAANDLGAHESR